MEDSLRKINIDTGEQFAHLGASPIVEAVIDIIVKPAERLDESVVRSSIEPQLEAYTFLDSQQEFNHKVTIGPEHVPTQTVTNTWKGIRFQSPDGKTTIQFNRDGLNFSRLAPYQSWDQFFYEAMHSWRIYSEIARPDEIVRLGVRFINRIELPLGDGSFEKYINPAPQSPQGIDLPFYGFLYQEMLAVPGHPYAINLTRTIQAPQDSKGFAVIIDIDVFTIQPGVITVGDIERSLEEMRWLKDKVFFGSVTDAAMEAFK